MTCSTASLEMPSNRCWSITLSNLIEILCLRTGSRPALAAGLSSNTRKELVFVQVLFAHTESQLLLTAFTRQSASIESYNMIGLLMVSQNFNPGFSASRKSNLYTALRTGPHFQCERMFWVFFCFVSMCEQCCQQKIDCFQEVSLSSFSKSDSSCKEICIRNRLIIIRWSHVINVIRPSVKNKHIVLQSWIHLLPSWMTMNWSHALDFTAFVETTLLSYFVCHPFPHTFSKHQESQLTVRSNPSQWYIKTNQGIAPSDSRSSGACLNMLIALHEMSNDSLWENSAQKDISPFPLFNRDGYWDFCESSRRIRVSARHRFHRNSNWYSVDWESFHRNCLWWSFFPLWCVVSFSSIVNNVMLSAESSPELVKCASLDRPKTTIGTKLSHLQGAILPIFIMICCLTFLPLVRIPIFFAKVPRDNAAGMSSRS